MVQACPIRLSEVWACGKIWIWEGFGTNYCCSVREAGICEFDMSLHPNLNCSLNLRNLIWIWILIWNWIWILETWSEYESESEFESEFECNLNLSLNLTLNLKLGNLIWVWIWIWIWIRIWFWIGMRSEFESASEFDPRVYIINICLFCTNFWALI